MRTNITYLPSTLGRLLLIVFLALLEGCSGENLNIPTPTITYFVENPNQQEDMEIEVGNSSMEDFMEDTMEDIIREEKAEEDISDILDQLTSVSPSNWMIPFSEFTREGNSNEQPMLFIDTHKSFPSTELNRGIALNNKRKERSDAEDKQEKEKEAEREKKKLRKEKEKYTIEEESTDELSLFELFEQLPDELRLYIFNYVGFPSISQCMLVSKAWNEFIKSYVTDISRQTGFRLNNNPINSHNNTKPSLVIKVMDVPFRYFPSKVNGLQSLLSHLEHTQVEELGWSCRDYNATLDANLCFAKAYGDYILDNADIKSLTSILEQSLTTVKSLNLANSHLDLVNLLKSLPTLPQLECLDLSGNNSKFQGMWFTLINPLKFPNLKKLKLENTYFALTSCKPMLGNLAQFDQLEELNLSNNYFLKEGGAINLLHKVLETCPNLKRLDLKAANLDAKGAQSLANALAKLSKLEILDLSANPGLLASGIIKVIKVCPNLKSIALDNMDLQTNKVKALTNALSKKLPKLEMLSLFQNYDLRASGVIKFIQACPNLKSVNIAYTGLTVNDVQSLKADRPQLSVNS